MDKIRVGFIGAGGLANSMHYPSLAEFEDAEIVAISELNPQRLQATADKYTVEARYQNYQQMLEQTDVDAVYVIMPPHHLFDVVATCLQAGKHVFIEKPPGVTTYQTASLAELAAKHNCLTMCGFNRRFIPLLVESKAQVESKGPIIQCTSTFLKYHTGGRYYNGSIDILTCDAIHAVDTLRWMGGEIRTLASSIHAYDAPFENSFNALVEFESGATGFLVTNWMVGKRVHTFEMHARGISAFVDGDDCARIYQDNKADASIRTADEAAASSETHKSYGFFFENRHFIDCVKANRQPQTCFADATRTMELVDRIYVARLS